MLHTTWSCRYFENEEELNSYYLIPEVIYASTVKVCRRANSNRFGCRKKCPHRQKGEAPAPSFLLTFFLCQAR